AVANHPADDADQRRLSQELSHDVERRRTDRLLQADLPHTLGHRHEHRVDDRQAADDQGQEGGRRGDGGEYRAALLEAIDQIAGSRCLDPADLTVDPVCDLVEVADGRPGPGVNVDAFGDLRYVDHVTYCDGQA